MIGGIMLVSVLVEIKALNEKTFTYSVPTNLIPKEKIYKYRQSYK